MSEHREQTPEQTKESDISNDFKRLEYAHKHLMAQAELRTKNFNFFLVSVGVLIFAASRSGDMLSLWIISLAAIVFGIAFRISDNRTMRLIMDARRPIYDLESRVGCTIVRNDPIQDIELGFSAAGVVKRNRRQSTTRAYRIVIGFIWLISFTAFVAASLDLLNVLSINDLLGKLVTVNTFRECKSA